MPGHNAFPYWRALCCAALAVVGPAVAAFAQGASQETLQGLSRDMQLGIRYYEEGKDTESMDRLMEVLTKGDPAERNMANEYLNLISRRMNPEQKTPAEPTTLRPNKAQAEPSGENPAPAPAPPIVPAPATMSDGDKALMRKEIATKIRGLFDAGLKELKANPDIKVLSMANGNPQALAIPSALLFQTGVAFQKDAIKILDALTKVVFGLGEAQVVILPEGTPMGDAKILDMRRTMGISAHLLSAGVAPPRVSVNLLNSQVDIPRPLAEFRGVIVLLAYDKPMALAADSNVGEEGGPPVSLGIYPETIRPDRDQGSVIEFAVQDPSSGLASWRFQLLQPSSASERDLAPLQEVVGGSPVFHQIYWNGRKNYFGAPLPAGRYECVLTATDGKNRQRSLHRWIQVLGPDGSLPKVLGAGAPPSDLAGAKAEPLIKEAKVAPSSVQIAAPAPKAMRKAVRRRPVKLAGKRSAARKVAAAAPAQARPSRPAPADLVLSFNQGTHQLTPAGEKSLAKIAQWMADYPLESVTVTGYSQTSEADAAALAERRAQMVAGLLVNKYQLDPKKITVNSHVAETPSYKVEVTLDKAE